MNYEHTIAFRVTHEQYGRIKEDADRAGIKVSRYVRDHFMGGTIVILNDFDEVIRLQKRIGANINQIATLVNMGKIQCPDINIALSNQMAILDQLLRIQDKLNSMGDNYGICENGSS